MLNKTFKFGRKLSSPSFSAVFFLFCSLFLVLLGTTQARAAVGSRARLSCIAAVSKLSSRPSDYARSYIALLRVLVEYDSLDSHDFEFLVDKNKVVNPISLLIKPLAAEDQFALNSAFEKILSKSAFSTSDIEFIRKESKILINKKDKTRKASKRAEVKTSKIFYPTLKRNIEHSADGDVIDYAELKDGTPLAIIKEGGGARPFEFFLYDLQSKQKVDLQSGGGSFAGGKIYQSKSGKTWVAMGQGSGDFSLFEVVAPLNLKVLKSSVKLLNPDDLNEIVALTEDTNGQPVITFKFLKYSIEKGMQIKTSGFLEYHAATDTQEFFGAAEGDHKLALLTERGHVVLAELQSEQVTLTDYSDKSSTETVKFSPALATALRTHSTALLVLSHHNQVYLLGKKQFKTIITEVNGAVQVYDVAGGPKPLVVPQATFLRMKNGARYIVVGSGGYQVGGDSTRVIVIDYDKAVTTDIEIQKIKSALMKAVRETRDGNLDVVFGSGSSTTLGSKLYQIYGTPLDADR